MLKILSYFCQNHRLTNLMFVMVLAGGVISWLKIRKEEMPPFETNWLRITANYPGASAEDVEHLVIYEIEKKLKGLSDIESVSSTASPGSASLRVELRPELANKQVVLQSIREAAQEANLPDRVHDSLSFRQFKTSEKAIIDIALINTDHHLLSDREREKLQGQSKTLENMLLASPLISQVTSSGKRQEEIQIMLDPELLKEHEIPASLVRSVIKEHHIRLPAGALEDPQETKISIQAELDEVEKLEELIISSNFDGRKILLKDLAKLSRTFKKNRQIYKINGYEAVELQVRKSAQADITLAQEEVTKVIERYRQQLSDSSIQLVVMDDESRVISNRIDIISSNGALGFILILICLLLFLDLRSGIWVAMGVPFSLCFTLIICHLLGYTVNNMTLAAVIVVLGIVVDDAIIVAENVSRYKSLGFTPFEASVQGTREILLPIVASILTTCVAFVPFYFFEGRFSAFVIYIPSIVAIMLMGSLFESVFILPSHLQGTVRIAKEKQGHWFFTVEGFFATCFEKVLKFRLLFVLLFVAILSISVYLFQNNLKYIMFPQSENSEVYIRAVATKAKNTQEAAIYSKEIEQMLLSSKAILAVRSRIGQSRRGKKAAENSLFYRIELLPRDKRNLGFEDLSKNWQEELESMVNFSRARVIKSRFGFSSGSAIEIRIQDNDEKSRATIAVRLKEELEKLESIVSSDIDQPRMEDRYELDLNREALARLNLKPQAVAESIRTFVEGNILYSVPKGDEEVAVRIANTHDSRQTIEQLLNKRVGNSSGYLVPIRELVTFKKRTKPMTIDRRDYRRTTMVYGDLHESPKMTTLEVAEYMEKEVFPKILKNYPNSVVSFVGEVEEARRAEGEFALSILIAVMMIYGILIVLFNSFSLPLLILGAIPFGIAGVVLAFVAHEKSSYGFFAIVGAIGMSGVVINDSIVLIASFKEKLTWQVDRLKSEIAQVTSSRLRAVLITTLTTVAGLFPTAYGFGGKDAMLAEMMLAMGWGLLFGTTITLGFIPVVYSYYADLRLFLKRVIG